jgi:hypothetical protein
LAGAFAVALAVVFAVALAVVFGGAVFTAALTRLTAPAAATVFLLGLLDVMSTDSLLETTEGPSPWVRTN